MEKVKKYGYYSIVIIFILSAITYILGIIYILGSYCWHTRLLPEVIWDMLDIVFYKEAGFLRIAQRVVIFVILSIILAIFYRKDISIPTIVLPGINLVLSIVWWTTYYWSPAITSNFELVYTIMSVICIVNIFVAGVFLIKDKEEFDYI